MKQFLHSLAALMLLLSVSAVTATASPTSATDTVAEAATTLPAALSTTIEFGPYTMAAPAGLLSRSYDNNQWHAALPGGRYTIMAMLTQGAPSKLKDTAVDAARNLGIANAEPRKISFNGFDGYMLTARKEAYIFTLALLRHDKETLTLIIREPETLQPLGPAAVTSLTTR